MCFGIFYSASASSKASKVVKSSYTARHTQSCFVLFCFMPRGDNLSQITIVWFRRL